MTVYRSSSGIPEPDHGADGAEPHMPEQSAPPERAADAADAEAARALLVAHVPDQDSGLCLVCYTPSPCRPANAAANRLVDLNQPLPPPEQTRPRRNGWRDWIWRPQHWRMPRTAPLITHAWRQRFATITPRPATANQRATTYLWPATSTRVGNTSPGLWNTTDTGKHRRQPANVGRHRRIAYTGQVTRVAW